MIYFSHPRSSFGTGEELLAVLLLEELWGKNVVLNPAGYGQKVLGSKDWPPWRNIELVVVWGELRAPNRMAIGKGSLDDLIGARNQEVPVLAIELGVNDGHHAHLRFREIEAVDVDHNRAWDVGYAVLHLRETALTADDARAKNYGVTPAPATLFEY